MSDTTLPTTPPIETDAGGQTPASLDKVRDILLGNQVRDFERRFARLEERLITETNSLVVRRATSYVEPRRT